MIAIFYLLIIKLRERVRVPFAQMDPYEAIIATFSQIFSFGI